MAVFARFRFKPPSLVTLLTLTLALNVRPAWGFDLGEWLRNPGYNGTNTIKEEIHCYALPFGAIGFASHVMTYLTVLCLSLGRNPLMPWQRLQHRQFNLIVASMGLAISFPMTVLTMIRCRNSWSFILIAVWKLVLSLTLTSMTIHAARMIIDRPRKKKTGGTGGKEEEDALSLISSTVTYSTNGQHHHTYRPGYNAPNGSNPYLNSHNTTGYTGYSNSLYESSGRSIMGNGNTEEGEEVERAAYDDTPFDQTYKAQFKNIWWWAAFYFLGAIIGFVGVMNIVGKNMATSKDLRIVTGVFGGLVLAIVILVFLVICLVMDDSGLLGKIGIGCLTGSGVAVFVLTVLFAFYTDWVLAALAEDMVGYPSSENAVFYWSYFAAKRLPMFSF
ncbi:hypothetical protein QBC46DRAFT_378898 [Diplogelasinospora grovesii]|uniref:Uncharacterized protein n=1 Tax=Diplogelasinospora grovesii TaxID=303347 RepID=A0AAN6S708_9PEZI|nr:hypothetical protein QBC46DRAFT_378898 [Diplogelasinospora grovesii]